MKPYNIPQPLQIKLRLVIILIAFSSCTDTYSQDNCNQVHLAPADLKETDSKKILVLVADDRSGSTSSRIQPDRMAEQHYKDFLQVFIDKGYKGQFDIRVIGNPPHTGFEPLLTIDPVYKPKPIPKDATLSIKAKLKCINVRIQDTCRIITDGNQKKINEYLIKIIRTKIINYKPNGRDITDIDHAFRDIEMKLNSSAIMGYNKIFVIVMCDGNDSNKSKNLTIKTNVPFELILIGWPVNKKIIDGQETHLSSVDDLINWFKNIKI